MQLLFEVEQTLALALHHARYGNARPTRNHLGHLVRINLLVNHGIVCLQLLELNLQVRDLFLGLLDAAVAQLSHLAIVAGTFGLLGFQLVRLDVLHLCLDSLHHTLLVLPAGLHLVALLAQFAQLLVQLRQLVLVILALDGLAFNLQLTDAVFYLIQLFGHRVNLYTQLGGRLINQVDSLVRQKPIAYIAVAQLGSCNQGIVLDTHLVVHLITFLQATQNTDGVFHTRLVDKHTLETAFQSLVFLKILLILGQRGSTNGPQLATCQGWLQDIGRIHGALAAAGTHQGVNLIDKEDNVAVALLHLLDNAF